MIPLNLPSTPFKIPESTNVFLLTGEPLTLVDTGYRSDPGWEALNNQLKTLGYEIGDLKQVLLTHAHPDHYGLAARIKANADVEILSHPESAPNFEWSFKQNQKGPNFLFETLRKTGAPEVPLKKRLEPQKKGIPPTEPITITRTVKNGEVISSGSDSWEVLELPGHAPGVIGLYCPEQEELIVSDHLLTDVNSRPGLFHDPVTGKRDHRFMGDYIETHRRIMQMNINIAWPSHGDPIDDVNNLIEHWVTKHTARAKFIAEPLEDGDMTAYQIWKTHFPKILPFDPVQGLIEIITYLDLFTREGKVHTYLKEGLIYYQL